MKYYYIFFDSGEIMEVCKLCDFEQVMEYIKDFLETGSKVIRVERRDENDRL